jgi:hypothetical protein
MSRGSFSAENAQRRSQSLRSLGHHPIHSPTPRNTSPRRSTAPASACGPHPGANGREPLLHRRGGAGAGRDREPGGREGGVPAGAARGRAGAAVHGPGRSRRSHRSARGAGEAGATNGGRDRQGVHRADLAPRRGAPRGGFGAPIAHEDHAQRACYAALRLRDELRRFAQELRRDRGLDVATRIGLNSGEVVVGKIGDDLRMDYTAQGHTVGLAQRMEALAEAGKVYLTAATAQRIEGYFGLEDLGAFNVKGVSAPVHAYALEGLGACVPASTVRARGALPLRRP